jgi:pimeloyl-ACP methyl ester carboxylesterase
VPSFLQLSASRLALKNEKLLKTQFIQFSSISAARQLFQRPVGMSIPIQLEIEVLLCFPLNRSKEKVAPNLVLEEISPADGARSLQDYEEIFSIMASPHDALKNFHFVRIAAVSDKKTGGDLGILSASATTENVGRIFHEFVANLGVPLHVVAHDFGAWCAYCWALLFPEDFKSLTLIEAGIPGITLLNDIQLSDYKRKWNFIFQMLPDLPAELTKGKEDIYVGWWFKNKVYKPGAVPPDAVAAYVRAYAREGRMDAAFDYCRRIVDDMEFNKKQFKSKLPIRLLAVGGQYSIPNMGDLLRPYFRDVESVVISDSGHFVPEEQPEALVKALLAFI